MPTPSVSSSSTADCAILRSYSTESAKWTTSTELQCDGVLPKDWSKCSWAMVHNRKLWWIDLYFGIITCDPFAEGFLERQRDPFAKLQQLHFIPLPGPSVIAESQDYLDKTRCVKVSNKKLRYVLLEPQAPVVSMWTLDDPDEALWSLQYTMSLSEVNSMQLAEVTPNLALIHPLVLNVLYFFMNGWILAVDVVTPLHEELAGVRDVLHQASPSMIQRCLSITNSYCSRRIPVLALRLGKIAESKQGNNISSDDLLRESDSHLFNSAQDLRKSIDDSTSEWLGNDQAWAMLKNPSIFQVKNNEVVTEIFFRADGSCMLADHILLQKIQPADHAYSTRKKQLKEHVLLLKVFGTTLCQQTMKGNVWERRRLTIQSDSTYSVIQWRIRGKSADGGQARRRGCEARPAKGACTNELPPAKTNAPRRTHDGEAAASNAPRRSTDAEAGLSVDDRINLLQAGQQKIIQMLERMGAPQRTTDAEAGPLVDELINLLQAGQQKTMQMLEQMGKQLDQIALVSTTAPSQPPSASTQARRSPTPVENSYLE